MYESLRHEILIIVETYNKRVCARITATTLSDVSGI